MFVMFLIHHTENKCGSCSILTVFLNLQKGIKLDIILMIIFFNLNLEHVLVYCNKIKVTFSYIWDKVDVRYEF